MPYFGVVLCCAFYPVGGKPYVISKGRKGANDKPLIESIKREFEKYDLCLGYNHLNFDLRLLNSRLLKWGLDCIPDTFQVDLYRSVKTIFKTTKFTPCSLKMVCEFLNISGKSRVEPDVWMRAALDNDQYALKKIVDHCRHDVLVLDKLFHKIKGKIRSISKA